MKTVRSRSRAMRVIYRLVAIGVMLCAVGCDDPSDTGDKGKTLLQGRVTDATGAPVAGAAVSVAYRLQGYRPPDYCNPTDREPVIAVAATFQFDLPTPAFVDVSIVDYLRRPVRTLVHGDLPPGSHRILWNGTDESGRRVPAGEYIALIHATGPGTEFREERRLFIYYCSREENLEVGHTTTDGNGDYRIETALLPLGERFEYFDDTGAAVGEFTVSDSVHVQAGVYVDPTWRSTAAAVRIDRSHDVRVDLVLP